MHRERRHTDVNLPTMVALPGQLAVQASVGLFMSRQVTGSRVIFAAFVACIPLFAFLPRERFPARSPVTHEKRVIRVTNSYVACDTIREITLLEFLDDFGGDRCVFQLFMSRLVGVRVVRLHSGLLMTYLHGVLRKGRAHDVVDVT